MSNIFRDSESLGKSNGKKWSNIWTFLFGSGLKLPRNFFFFLLSLPWSTLLWHRCNYPHRSRDSVSPVCGIFLSVFLIIKFYLLPCFILPLFPFCHIILILKNISHIFSFSHYTYWTLNLLFHLIFFSLIFFLFLIFSLFIYSLLYIFYDIMLFGTIHLFSHTPFVLFFILTYFIFSIFLLLWLFPPSYRNFCWGLFIFCHMFWYVIFLGGLQFILRKGSYIFNFNFIYICFYIWHLVNLLGQFLFDDISSFVSFHIFLTAFLW